MKLITTLILFLTFFNSFSQGKISIANRIGISNANNRNINHKDGTYFQDLKRSTLQILTVGNSQFGTAILINTVSNSFVGNTKKYYILTCNHTFTAGSLGSRDEIYISFNYELPDATDRGNPNRDSSIAEVWKIPVETVVIDHPADIVLLEVSPNQLSDSQKELFNNAYAAGWSTNPERDVDDYINISHPRADHKKIFTKPLKSDFGDNIDVLTTGAYGLKGPDLKHKVFGLDFNDLNTNPETGSSGSAFFDTSNFKNSIAGVFVFKSTQVNGVSLLENSWKLSGTNGLQDYLDPLNTWISQIPGGYVKKTIKNESTTNFDLSLSEKGHFKKNTTLDFRPFFDMPAIGKKKEDLLGAGGMLVSSGTDNVYLTITPSDDPNYLLYGVEYDSSNTNNTQVFQGNSWNIHEPPTNSFPGVTNDASKFESTDLRLIKNYKLQVMKERSVLSSLLSYFYGVEEVNSIPVSIELSTLNDETSTTSIRAIKFPRHMPYNAVELFDGLQFENLWRSKNYPDSRGNNSEELYIDIVASNNKLPKTIKTGNNGGYLNMVNKVQTLGVIEPSSSNKQSKLQLFFGVINKLNGKFYYKVWIDFKPVINTNNQYSFDDDAIELVAEGNSLDINIDNGKQEVFVDYIMPTASQLGLSTGEEKYYRLRIAVSDENNISENGFYQNGEVEDYQIKVSVPSTQNRIATDNQENNNLITKTDNSKNKIKTDFNIFPNPAKDKLNILVEAQESGPVTIELFDLSGRKVYEMKKPNISKGHQLITLRNLKVASGEYIMSIRAGNVKRNEKVVFE